MVTICVNCGKEGHKYKECSDPITSFGILAYKYCSINDLNEPLRHIVSVSGGNLNDPDPIKFLLVQRRNTIGYIDFIRGKYPSHEPDKTIQLKTHLCEMTIDERKSLETKTFNELWNDLWVNHDSRYFREEKSTAAYKYSQLNILQLLRDTEGDYPHYLFEEFGIPKGRKNLSEDTRSCAIREFQEETGYKRDDFTFIQMDPVVETYIGTDGIMYRHIYYVVCMKSEIRTPSVNHDNYLQSGEVKNIGWFSINQAMHIIRPYDIAKKHVLKSVYKKVCLH